MKERLGRTGDSIQWNENQGLRSIATDGSLRPSFSYIGTNCP